MYQHPCWFDNWIQSSPSKRIPDATHSKTLRNDSPAPIGLSDVAIAFSTSRSRGYMEMKAEKRDDIYPWCCTIKRKTIFFYHKAAKNCAGLYNYNYNNHVHTHPVSGAQVGTRLHKSLMSRITTTAEFRSLTLAWRHKQKPVKSEELLFLTPKTKHGKVRTSLIQMIAHFSPQAVCLSTETTFQTGVELILRKLSLTEDILMNQIICCSRYQWFLQISHRYGSVIHSSWLNNSNFWHFKGDLLCISLFSVKYKVTMLIKTGEVSNKVNVFLWAKH